MNTQKENKKLKLVSFFLGLAALAWFLIRVIPKPSRASYPCQRAAFPLASAFVIWLTGVVSSMFGLKYLGLKFLHLTTTPPCATPAT